MMIFVVSLTKPKEFKTAIQTEFLFVIRMFAAEAFYFR